MSLRIKKLQAAAALILGLNLLGMECASAQHPIDVQRKAAEGEYFHSLLAFEKMPKRKATTSARIAAGKSAWALGLTDRAIQEFDNALHDQTLDKVTRARLFLSRGIIEFQEERYQTALLYAQRAAAGLESGPLRARIWLLWGQALSKTGSLGAAKEKLTQAYTEANKEDLAEIDYLLGDCALKLGQAEAARAHFESVPLNHERTPDAIRALAKIAIDSGNMESAKFWLRRGRSDFPDNFLDSWVDYALVQVAIKERDTAAVKSIVEQAQGRYAPSDFWLNMLNAAAETHRWQQVPSGSK